MGGRSRSAGPVLEVLLLVMMLCLRYVFGVESKGGILWTDPESRFLTLLSGIRHHRHPAEPPGVSSEGQNEVEEFCI